MDIFLEFEIRDEKNEKKKKKKYYWVLVGFDWSS